MTVALSSRLIANAEGYRPSTREWRWSLTSGIGRLKRSMQDCENRFLKNSISNSDQSEASRWVLFDLPAPIRIAQPRQGASSLHNTRHSDCRACCSRPNTWLHGEEAGREEDRWPSADPAQFLFAGRDRKMLSDPRRRSATLTGVGSMDSDGARGRRG